jgi:hypothetical protein
MPDSFRDTQERRSGRRSDGCGIRDSVFGTVRVRGFLATCHLRMYIPYYYDEIVVL